MWFNKIKDLATKIGYQADMKAYKGSVADFTIVMRVVLTTLNMTPNLYDILGKERMVKWL